MQVTLKSENGRSGAIGLVEVQNRYLWILREAGVVAVSNVCEGDGEEELIVEEGKGALLIGGVEDGGSVFLVDEEGYLRCYNGVNRELLRSLKAHDGGVSCLEVTSSIVVTCGCVDGQVKVFDARDGSLLSSFSVDFEVTAVSTRSGSILLGTADGKVFRRSGVECKEIFAGGEGQPTTSSVTAICSNPFSNRVWIGLSSGHVVVFRKSKIIFSSRAHDGRVTAIQSAPNSLIVTAGSDGLVGVWKASRSSPRLLYNSAAGGKNITLASGEQANLHSRRVWIVSENATRAWNITVKLPKHQPTSHTEDQTDRIVKQLTDQIISKDSEVLELKRIAAGLQDELDELRSIARRREAEVWSARKISRRRCDRSMVAGGVGSSLVEEQGGEGGPQRELDLAIRMLHEMDINMRESEERFEQLCRQQAEQARELAVRNRAVQESRSVLTEEDCRNQVKEAEELLITWEKGAREIFNDRKRETNSVRQRLTAIEKAREPDSNPPGRTSAKKLPSSAEAIRAGLDVPVRRSPEEILDNDKS
uniref:Uncharacterized protein n=1 Tax=Rhodosorus marinus TaxID=101924 RepID=A0A7S3A8Y5_9RHOD|mmetsp:Transcript_6361/g.27076  ORF Transcript_6361/g.27076 Transcript_6361/m.27076 type:complete len:534 (+) Transcript_6361:192-1793(+)